MEDHLGLRGLARLLGMTPNGARARSRKPDFPTPAGSVDGVPYWRHADVVAYARFRTDRYQERPAIEALAADHDDDWLTVADAARTIGASEEQLRSLIRFGGGYGPGLKRAQSTGDVTHVHRSTLGVYARAIGAEPIETRRAA